MRIIFILSRYVPFVGLAMTVYCSVASTHGGIPHHDIFIALYDGVRWLGITAAELLLVVRTYAVWGCNKRFLTVTLVSTPIIAIAVLLMSDLGASQSGDLTGVFEEGQYSSIIYGLLMLVELDASNLTNWEIAR